ncbi:hypothetical protein, partial [uncultured Ottowia sp.]|uniref:hypothetical protein n=1 Tax=uncultured Ottowia sp. TaxID=543067 RepID=UPI002592A2A6
AERPRHCRGRPDVIAAGLQAVVSDSCHLNEACQSGRPFSWVLRAEQYQKEELIEGGEKWLSRPFH